MRNYRLGINFISIAIFQVEPESDNSRSNSENEYTWIRLNTTQSVLESGIESTTQSELTDTNDYNVDDTFYKMHTREFPSSVHGEVSESPKDVTEPRIEERTDDGKKIAEERNCAD